MFCIPLYSPPSHLRQNAQYTTMQESLYNKYAMSAPSQNSSTTTATSDPEAHLAFVKRLLACQVVEMLVPWLYCVYPPITVCCGG